MKIILAALILVLSAAPLRAAEVIFPYSAFGPQAAAYELIGMAWWQWDSQGDDEARDYPIKVVVYWDQTKEETAKRHPVDQAKQQDFRYVEYSKATEHLERTIKSFKEAKLDATIMERALAQLKQHRTEQNRTEQNRTEQNRTEQNRTEQNRTEQNRTEQNRTEQVDADPTRYRPAVEV